MSVEGKLGPLLIDIAGICLTEEDRNILLNPWVGGVILFSRNFESLEQLRQLVAEIKSLKTPRLLVTIDQEGGRVQRIKAPLSELPAMAELGRYYDACPEKALASAEHIGWLMASELLELGIDMSFAPVLDLDYGQSQVIGSRSFHSCPDTVALLAGAWVKGMNHAGMKATGKHFPGHGGVVADTHDESALSEQQLAELEAKDIKPFVRLNKILSAVMTAHIVFPSVDRAPVTYSRRWLKDYWRGHCHFDGVIISDDLCMQAAVDFEVDVKERVFTAIDAGCDLVLLCNDRQAVTSILSEPPPEAFEHHAKISSLYGAATTQHKKVSRPQWQAAQRALTEVASLTTVNPVETKQANMGA